MTQYIPNTALASVAKSETEIYTYAQSYYGPILEIKGKLSGNPAVYTRTGSVNTVAPTESDLPARRLTPIAAVTMKDWHTSQQRRYVFYFNNVNRLCDAYFYEGEWYPGSIYDQNWVAAPYSKLAAKVVTNHLGVDFVCVYYQNTSESGAVQQVNWGTHGWQTGPAPFDDPPLFGTSLSAVVPQDGIKSKSSVQSGGDSDVNINQPVVFFQYDNLKLGSTQDIGSADYITYDIQNPADTLSAHTNIAAVDDGSNCYVFYTGDENLVRAVSVNADGALKQPELVPLDQPPLPGTSLTAVLFKSNPEKVVMFYLLHYDTERQSTSTTNVFASTLTKSGTSWSVSPHYRVVY